MPADYEDQLTSVQAAIQKIVDGGQDVTYNGKRVTYGDLQTLYDRERFLQTRIDRQARGGIRVRRGVPL